MVLSYNRCTAIINSCQLLFSYKFSISMLIYSCILHKIHKSRWHSLCSLRGVLLPSNRSSAPWHGHNTQHLDNYVLLLSQDNKKTFKRWPWFGGYSDLQKSPKTPVKLIIRKLKRLTTVLPFLCGSDNCFLCFVLLNEKIMRTN